MTDPTMQFELLPPTSDIIEFWWALIFFGALYFFLWVSGENMRVRKMFESVRVRKLRFVFSCLIAAIWLLLLISPLTQINLVLYPLTLVILFLLVVIPFVIIIIDLTKQYKTRLS